MTPEQWQKIRIVVEEALELAPDSRSAFLSRACTGDSGFRREVESLLNFENAENSMLEQNAFAVVRENKFVEKAKNFIGEQIGNYKIVGELGAGGMGLVFLAERSDGAFDQKVALKLIKRGMDSEAILRRFVNERQILASLKHQNIAHLIDGGTTSDDLPFFVMEYVEGVPITDYASRKNLDIRERLKLFREVCAAVSFAHQNLIVHRDLKPSNILVTVDGKVKLLDFGIAKLLKSETNDAATLTGNFIFTPEYASPEQVRGEKLTTTTDVYSLGVILYELLTGYRPFQTESRNLAEIIRAVCETEPKPPSAAVSSQQSAVGSRTAENKWETDENKGQRTKDKGQTNNPKSQIPNPKSLRGDLDNIILKALRKEPERRYSSVEQFAEDVRRYLEGLPVLAGNNSWNYRAGKFVSRHRTAIIFAALVVLVLIGGIAGTTWQAIRAEREKQKAERRFENLRKISNSLVSEIERAIRDLPGSIPAREILLTRALEQLDALASESDGNTDLQLELAWAYQNLGAMPDRKLSVRREIYEKAVALTEKIIAAEPDNLKARDRLAMLYLDLIVVSRLRGDVEYTIEFNQRAVKIADEIKRDSVPLTDEFKDSVWTANYHYVLTLQQIGKTAEAVETARKILPTAEELYKSGDATDHYNFMKPHLTRLQIGYGLSYAGDYQNAVKEFETALAECQAEAAKRPNADILRRNEANIRLQLAAALENAGNPNAALENVRIALAIREQMAANNPKDFDFQIALADAELSLGQMLMRQNQPQTIVSRFRRALEIYQKIAAIDAERIQAQILIARTQANLGYALIKSENFDEGFQNLREAVKFYESVNAAATVDVHLKRQFAEACAFLAEVSVKNKTPENIAEGRRYYEKSLNLWLEMQNSKTLKKSDFSKPDEISQRLAELN